MDTIRGFSSKVVDLRAIPSESLERIAAMFSARRERAVSTDATAADDTGQPLPGAEELEAEERVARDMIAKSERRAFDVVQQQYQGLVSQTKETAQALQRAAEAERERQRRIHKVEQQIFRESFWNFVKKQQESGQWQSKDGKSVPEATIDDATAILSTVYRGSCLPFATDPEECWRRGIVRPPEAQTPVVIRAAPAGSVVLPRYEDFAESVRKKYEAYQASSPDRPAAAYTATSSPGSSPTTRTTHAALPSPSIIQRRATPMETFVANYPWSAPPE